MFKYVKINRIKLLVPLTGRGVGGKALAGFSAKNASFCGVLPEVKISVLTIDKITIDG